MSRRLKLEDKRGLLTADARSTRQKQESSAYELGVPGCPDYLWNNRPLYALWKHYSKELLKLRRLAYCDQKPLLELCESKLRGDREAMEKVFNSTWKKRAPFPAPEGAEFSLQDFIAKVREERESFSDRIISTETFTKELDGREYEFPANDATTIAREYARDVLDGKVVAGELIKRAAARFISDLATGFQRGFFFDVVAARHIVEFAEKFCDLKPLPWQVFVLTNCYGWKKPSGARRFTEAWVSTAKKSGKTRLASCVALFALIADCERYPDVFAAATKKEQSRLVWRDAKRCVNDNAELRAHVQRWAGALSVRETDGNFTPLSSDEKSMDGLRPSTIIADEVAFWGDREQWDKLTKGVVSRVQPLVFAITTAGSSRQCFAFSKFDLGEKILRGIFVDDTTFVAIFSIDKTDDPMNEQCWPKANPSLGVTIQPEHLRKIRDEVLQEPSGLNAWLQYHCNIWPDVALARSGSIPVTKWEKCSGLELIGETDAQKAAAKFILLNADLPCYAGLDWATVDDLACVACIWPKTRFAEGAEPTRDKCVVIPQFFMPEVGLLEKEKAWGVPLSTWVRQGFIDLFAGDMNDPDLLRAYLVKHSDWLRIHELRFDPWGIPTQMAKLNESGAIKCVGLSQIPKELTTPCRELLLWVNRQQLVHFNNPVLAWCAGNVILQEDPKHGGIKPDKPTPKEKIDGISALVNAISAVLAAPPPSVYEDRGIISL